MIKYTQIIPLIKDYSIKWRVFLEESKLIKIASKIYWPLKIYLGVAGGKLALKKAAGVGLAKAGLGLVGGKVALVKAKKAAPAIAVAGGLGAAGLGAAGLGMHSSLFTSCSI